MFPKTLPFALAALSFSPLLLPTTPTAPVELEGCEIDVRHAKRIDLPRVMLGYEAGVKENTLNLTVRPEDPAPQISLGNGGGYDDIDEPITPNVNNTFLLEYKPREDHWSAVFTDVGRGTTKTYTLPSSGTYDPSDNDLKAPTVKGPLPAPGDVQMARIRVELRGVSTEFTLLNV
ncbi:MAG: hypothetical protein AAF726_05350 [Planctomycetota bacterium]